jgi:dipeptidyl aminopeptidase/acylaminoacyl peptidase
MIKFNNKKNFKFTWNVMLKTSLLSTLLFTLIIATSSPSYASTSKELPISAFGNLPAFSQLKLSPNGKNLAFIKNHDGLLVLTILNIKTGEQNYIIQADNIEVTLNWHTWASDDIILFSAGYSSSNRNVKYTKTRLYKFDISRDTKISLAVEPRKSKKEIYAQFQDNVISYLPEKKDKIIMSLAFDNFNLPSVYEVDLKTDKRKKITGPTIDIKHWYADQQGNVRIARGKDETKIFYRLYDTNGKKLKDLWSYEIFEKEVIHILGFDLDPNILYVRALNNGKYAVFSVDLRDEQLSKKLILADEAYDVDGSLIYSPKTGAVIGLHHNGEDDNKTYWDKDYIRLKAGINKVLPESNNTIISMSDDLQHYVIYSNSDEEPGSYYLGDRTKGTLNYVASRYPQINESNYAAKQLISYQARDGLNIEGYLTTPKNASKNKLPAIILPHGGPMARDYRGFDYWAELFANRGYVVFQPNFRGSSGYGYDFEMAAIKGWGKAMQDDLEDAAKWLQQHANVDAKKMCIAGASYGGYAALMAAVKHGETFQCAASFAGVSDIELIVSKARYFTNKEIVRKQFGEDSDKLEAVSPVNFAKNINIPILLIHGTDDKVVPVEHSRDMADELEDYDKDVKYLEIEGANHHLSVQKHRLQTLEEMLKFFNKHLKS